MPSAARQGSSTADRELDELLSEEPSAAAARAATRLVLDGAPIILYGAGTLGLAVLEKLRRAGLDAAAFADDTPSKQGTSIAGLPVMTAAAATGRFGDQAVFVVTILNPLLRFVDARARLRSLTSARVVSFLDLAWTLPESFLPYYQFERPESVLPKGGDIRAASQLFADDESRRQLAAHLRFRLHLDYEALPPNSRADYFPADVVPSLDRDCVFVDCGAFDGDTVRRFIAEQGQEFGAVYAFEPDEANARLESYVGSLPPGQAGRVHVSCAAVGDARGNAALQHHRQHERGHQRERDVCVNVVRVDEVVPVTGSQHYVKYDVEGGEWEALRGTERLLQAARPLLAVSVYHRPDDLWQLPLYLHSLNLGYRLYLRTQGEDGADVICYAIPR